MLGCRQVGFDLFRRQDPHFVLRDFGRNAVICRVSEDQALFDRAVEGVVQHRVYAANCRVAQPRLVAFLRFAEPPVFLQFFVEPLQVASGQIFQRNIPDAQHDVQFNPTPVILGSRKPQMRLCV